jgi:excisionase family DNA binding protein
MSTQEHPAPEAIDKKAVAKLLSISVRSVERLTATGKLPSIKLNGSRRYPLRAILKMLEGPAGR